MKPQANGYISLALLIVFGLNEILVFILPKVTSGTETVILILFTLAEVAAGSLLTAKFFSDSNKYDRNNRNKNSHQ